MVGRFLVPPVHTGCNLSAPAHLMLELAKECGLNDDCVRHHLSSYCLPQSIVCRPMYLPSGSTEIAITEIAIISRHSRPMPGLPLNNSVNSNCVHLPLSSPYCLPWSVNGESTETENQQKKLVQFQKHGNL